MSLGALALHSGVLYVARRAHATFVRPFDWDGTALAQGFHARDSDGGEVDASAMCVDRDHRLWIADGEGSRVLCYSVHGRLLASIDSVGPAKRRRLDLTLESAGDHPGGLWQTSALGLCERFEEDGHGSIELYIGCAGTRRHALQRYSDSGRCLDTLRSEGLAARCFEDVRGLSFADGRLWVAEAGAKRVQVFRQGEFHVAWRFPSASGAVLVPIAVAALDDGRAVVAARGQEEVVFLVDRDGRWIQTIAQGAGSDAQVREGSQAEISHVVAIAAQAGESEGSTRIAVMDQDGERVQVFTLGGRCFGALPELPG